MHRLVERAQCQEPEFGDSCHYSFERGLIQGMGLLLLFRFQQIVEQVIEWLFLLLLRLIGRRGIVGIGRRIAAAEQTA